MNNKRTNLLSLNDYCLEVIFENLDLLEQIRLSLCHTRLEWVFVHMIVPHLDRNFCFDDAHAFTEWDFRQLFYTVGKCMEIIILGPKFQRNASHLEGIYSYMQECRLRVKHIIIHSREPKQCVSLLSSLQPDYISELDLFECNLCDNDLQYLCKLRNLKGLGLGWNYQIEGIVLKDLHNLQRLMLCCCDSITNEALTECCKNLRLKFLDIRMFNNLSHVETAVQYCTSLETLKTTSLNVDAAKLPNLRSLEIRHQNSQWASRFYEALLKFHQHDLLELKLFDEIYVFFPTAARFAQFKKLRSLALGNNAFSVCRDVVKLISGLTDLEEIHLINSLRIRDKHLLPLITKCTKLKRVDIRMCRYISNNFVWKTMIILKRRAANSKEIFNRQPLTILVNGTRITRNILDSVGYKRNSDLLKLLFHNSNTQLSVIFKTENHKSDCSCFSCRKSNKSNPNEMRGEMSEEYGNLSDDDEDDDDDDGVDIDEHDLESTLISME
ncbi:uncharacterized protein LOC105665492 isoform X1 [Ceratitis capitata]|uniref:uncharacterized protein LOC105665492 isoform X1 n=1 Tax=Ceratitis capitata TaxID=7213 RepID=UPI000A0F8238|nr:uncharacterized protein LOC105665492 isoform X1 [Ceratitis capitata]